MDQAVLQRDDTVTSSGSFEARETTPSRSRAVSIYLYCFYFFASLQFLRSYFVIDSSYLDVLKYEAGSERMPYQARILMSFLMRHAGTNRLIVKAAGVMGAPLHSPETFSIFLVNLFALALLVWVVRAFYLKIAPSGQLSWLPYALVLWMMAVTYIVRFQEAIYFPYDLLAAALFTLCVYLCYARRYLLLVPVFVLASFNRETIILVVPLILLNIETLPRISRRQWKEPAVAVMLVCIWFLIYRSLNHLYAHNASESFSRIHSNLMVLRNPMQWSQIASACGFLLAAPFVFWRQMRNLRLRRYSLIIPVWIAIIFCVGLLGESRVFGELIGFLAVYCTVLFESTYVTRKSYCP
ncbi:hypothetical protein EDE15_2319 [Edaphobacter aggregans]|uniref:Uncharacterized protein n=1 Tax=Edaphobacter aggregans TaxID=570835 RepID=A0A428MIQ1_9BACT|nr:hypothetical protein [Edaphobacter aggregans]RSL16794.1 hypothetical protein EDE15_2319 [Edaphobacter aggregans]